MKITAHDLLRQILRCNDDAPTFGMRDQRDNNGTWYQSADLAAWLNEARKLIANPEAGAPAGMVAWHGGNSAPADWDCDGAIMHRDGTLLSASSATQWLADLFEAGWTHDGWPGDIVAYTPKQATPTDEAVLGEREACADLADGFVVSGNDKFSAGRDFAARKIAAAIRARSAPGSGVESSDA